VTALKVTREQILAFRRRQLDEQSSSLREAAWAGVKDSMPRAALLSFHARVAGVGPLILDDPSLAQVWGPSYHVYVVAAQDHAVFTLGRLPDRGRIRERAEDLAARLEALLGSDRMRFDDAGVALGTHGNNLRYAALTGRLAIRWEGARRPLVWMVPAPEIDAASASRELARRFLHVFGPTTPEAFARWASIGAQKAVNVFEQLRDELIPVGGEARLLASDEAAIRGPARAPAAVRLLPSGDNYTLGVTDGERAFLLPDAAQRAELWTPRVWPGAVLAGGKIVGTWRRARRTFDVQLWQKLTPATRDAIVAEAEALPLPDEGKTVVRFE
jgi:hypothetical protein